MIREELEDAEHYAREYVLNSESDPRLAELFKRLALAELDHANWEHTEAVRLIQASGREAPPSMQAVWDWEHELLTEKTAKIKLMLS